MGGVQIKNCTAVPLKIQLCQVGVLYHGLVQPGECFERKTGAVHFTIRATVSDKDDTRWTDSVLPIVGVVAASLAAVVTVAASIGLYTGAIGTTGLVYRGLVSGAKVVSESDVVGTGGALLTKELVVRLLSEAKKDHCYISSAGWYFGGENCLEIHGGPHILASKKGFEYKGTLLRIVDSKNPNRHN